LIPSPSSVLALYFSYPLPDPDSPQTSESLKAPTGEMLVVPTPEQP
jgi:hypothetical protein